MASLQNRNGSYKLTFMHDGKRRYATLGKVSEKEAEAMAGKIDLLLMRLKQGLLTIPQGVEIEEFVLSDGKITEAKKEACELTLRQLGERYIGTHRGSLEESTLDTAQTHFKHFHSTLGSDFRLPGLTLADLQRYVTQRAKQGRNGKPLSAVTLRLEITTLRTAWNWAALNGLITGQFPGKGLVYPKGQEKPPYQTMAEIEKRISAGGLTEEQQSELWESLYLRVEEVKEVLVHVASKAAHAWIYPLVATAAYTGARRSELLRILVSDVNLETGILLIREKKRSKRQRTTRHVSIAPPLKEVLAAWLAKHPGGRFLFCQSGFVERSKKRSQTTGHKGKERASTAEGRRESVQERGEVPIAQITKSEAHNHFKRTLKGSKWDVLRGLHMFRHSFISCLAAAGIDQRIIDEFVGHCSDEQRKRYRHLLPDVKQRAISSVFH